MFPLFGPKRVRGPICLKNISGKLMMMEPVWRPGRHADSSPTRLAIDKKAIGVIFNWIYGHNDTGRWSLVVGRWSLVVGSWILLLVLGSVLVAWTPFVVLGLLQLHELVPPGQAIEKTSLVSVTVFFLFLKSFQPFFFLSSLSVVEILWRL